MTKALVAYFSASGTTKKLARKVADAAGADLFEIVPEQPYSRADLDWTNKSSRSSVEMNNPSSRPGVATHVDNMADYDVIFLGFPIWWYIAPTIVNTFLEEYDLAGKTIVCFATSGGSGMGKTAASLEPSAPGATVVSGQVLNRASGSALESFVTPYL